MATKAKLEQEVEDLEKVLDEIAGIVTDDDLKASAKLQQIAELVLEEEDEDDEEEEDEEEAA